jgi:hypothetical protein
LVSCSAFYVRFLCAWQDIFQVAGQKMSFAAKTPGQVREFFIFPHLRHPAAPRLGQKRREQENRAKNEINGC